MNITQNETRITRPFKPIELLYGEQRSVQVEQVIAPDGGAAIRIRTWRVNRHNGVDAAPECVGDHLMRFPSSVPLCTEFGVIVGQWSAYEMQRGRYQALPVNGNTSTYNGLLGMGRGVHYCVQPIIRSHINAGLYRFK